MQCRSARSRKEWSSKQTISEQWPFREQAHQVIEEGLKSLDSIKLTPACFRNYDLFVSFPPDCSRADAEVQDHARSGRQTRQPDLTELTEWCIYQAWLKIWLSRQTTHFKRLLLAAPPSPPSWLLPCNPPAFSRHSPAHAMSVAVVPILVFQLSTCSSTCKCKIAPILVFKLGITTCQFHRDKIKPECTD